MAEVATNRCAGCQRLQEQLEQLRATIARLEEQLAWARKDSSTSSKPSSSDIVKHPKPSADSPSQIGGQPGCPKHDRVPFRPIGSPTRSCITSTSAPEHRRRSQH